jgi:quercetin dioxygenase-like cupin family protein
MKVGPDIYKLAFENERVRAMEVTFKPGAKIAMHSHPDHYVYIMTPGKLKITNSSGATSELAGKAGESTFIKAESHMAENIGSTEFKALVVELKEAAPAPPEKAKE